MCAWNPADLSGTAAWIEKFVLGCTGYPASWISGASVDLVRTFKHVSDS